MLPPLVATGDLELDVRWTEQSTGGAGTVPVRRPPEYTRADLLPVDAKREGTLA